MLNIDENEFKRNIAEKIKFYRKESQEKTAEHASISVHTVSKIEREVSVPSSLSLVNVCNALGITPNDVLEDFILNKEKLLTTKLNLEFNDLTIEEKTFVLQFIEFLKNHRK